MRRESAAASLLQQASLNTHLAHTTSQRRSFVSAELCAGRSFARSFATVSQSVEEKVVQRLRAAAQTDLVAIRAEASIVELARSLAEPPPPITRPWSCAADRQLMLTTRCCCQSRSARESRLFDGLPVRFIA